MTHIRLGLYGTDAVSKANRQKGVKREKYRFTCDSHDDQYRGPVRFEHEQARKDWNSHNLSGHDGKLTTMTKDEAIALLLAQKIEGASTGPLDVID